jgi:regulatory protein
MFTDDEAQLRSKLRKSMMGLLARREHSRLELHQKMKQRGFESELINPNLDDFTEHDWQSDERYSEMLLRSRILKCHGPVKIAMELKNKGLSSNIIECCLSREINWTALAIDALQKKYSQPPSDQNERNKHYRFLVQRGFTSEQVKSAMKYQKSW